MSIRDFFRRYERFKHYRSVTVTNHDGHTKVKLDALFADEDFLAKSKRLEEFAQEILPINGIPPRP